MTIAASSYLACVYVLVVLLLIGALLQIQRLQMSPGMHVLMKTSITLPWKQYAQHSQGQ